MACAVYVSPVNRIDKVRENLTPLQMFFFTSNGNVFCNIMQVRIGDFIFLVTLILPYVAFSYDIAVFRIRTQGPSGSGSEFAESGSRGL